MKELPPIPTGFTSVVASREFVVVRGDVTATVLFEVGLPVRDVETVDGFDWRCPLRITEGASQRERQACGVDSFQALQLGLGIVDEEARSMSRAERTGVRLFGEPYEPAARE